MGIFNLIPTILGKAKPEKPRNLGRCAAVALRSGYDSEGKLWTPDIVVAAGGIDPADLEAAIGGMQWERDFSAGKFNGTLETFDTLSISQEAGVVHHIGEGAPPVLFPDLTGDRFRMGVRVMSLNSLRREFTMRLFLAPAAKAGDHRYWRELTRFTRRFGPKEKLAFCAPPPQAHYEPLPPNPGAPERFDRYILLLYVSDTFLDKQLMKDCGCGEAECVSGLGFPVGYPFERPLEGDIAEIISSREDMVQRSLKVEWK